MVHALQEYDPISDNALAVLYFHCALGFSTQILAYTLDSLVRVSRRVEANHLIRIANMRVVTPTEVWQASSTALLYYLQASTGRVTLLHIIDYILSRSHSQTVTY